MADDQSSVGARSRRQNWLARAGQECRRCALVGRPVQCLRQTRESLDRWGVAIRQTRFLRAVAHRFRARLRTVQPELTMKSYELISPLLVACCFALASLPLAAQTIAITGGKVYPVSGPPIEGGTVIISNGKITAVGASVAIPASAQRIDATG